MERVRALAGSQQASASVGAAHLLVTRIARLVYSWTMLHPSFGSTRTSPPSPPKFDPIVDSPSNRMEPPLSCRPPETIRPPLLRSAAGSNPVLAGFCLPASTA
jgi:hypothetical protein